MKVYPYSGLMLTCFMGLFASSSEAQDVFMWNYEGTNTSISAPNVTGADNPRISDAHYAEIGGTDMSDSQVKRWQTLLTSGYLYGASSNLVRAHDTTEDWSVNWSTPDTEAGSPSSRWSWIEVGTLSSTFVYRTMGPLGPHAGELIRGNNNLLAVGDDAALFYDPDGSFSYYLLGGGLINDYEWTTLTDGTLDGSSLSSILKSSFLGTEQGQLAFLTGPDTIDFYLLSNGTYLRSADYSQVETGPLAGATTLVDIIDGKTEYTFLGIDGATPGPLIAGVSVTVPEPSAIVGLGSALAVFGLRRSRKNVK